MMYMENDIQCLEEITLGYLDKDDLLSLTQMTNSAPIPLTKPQVRMVLDIIDYYKFMYWNGDRVLANPMNIHNLSPISFLMCFIDCPTQWHTKDFEDWKRKGQPTFFVEHAASFASTTTATEIWSEDIPTEINSSPRFADVHSHNIPNDGEILLLPLFSPVYRVEQADEIDNAKY